MKFYQLFDEKLEMDMQEQSNELRLLLEKLFTSLDQTIRKEAEIQLNLFANSKNDTFFSILAEIIVSKTTKGSF